MSPPCILIVDDDPVHLRLLENVLCHQTGANILTARCGFEAIRTIASRTYEIGLILIDIHMPGCDGVELLMHLSAADCQAEVIIMSDSQTMLPAVARLARASGLNVLGTLRKPIATGALQLVNQWGERQAGHDISRPGLEPLRREYDHVSAA